MSDERWLSKDERDVIGGWFQQRQPNREAFEYADVLLDHAEAADELIADARKAAAYALESFRWILKEEPRTGGAVKAAMSVGKLERLLARVDALTKDTA